MIRRGSTPSYTITVDGIGMAYIEDIYVTFEQDDVEITKHGDDMTFTDTGCFFMLTQEDTLKFEKGSIEIQIRVKTTTGVADGTDIEKDKVKEVLYEKVI